MTKDGAMKKFHEIELEKSFDLIQTSQNLRIQVSIFFATVNLGTLSFGVSQSKSVFFLFAASLFWIMIIIDNAISSMLAHAYYRVIYLHKLYVEGDLAFSPNIHSRLAERIAKAINMEDGGRQLQTAKAFKTIPYKTQTPYSS